MNTYPLKAKEWEEKEQKLRTLLTQEQLDGVCLFKFTNFSWFTAGGTNRVVTGSEMGCAVLLMTKDQKYIIAPSNEMDRLLNEQVYDQDYMPIIYPWYETPMKSIQHLIDFDKLGCDIAHPHMRNVASKIDPLRYSLTDNEILKARELANICSDAVSSTCSELQTLITEFEIAAQLSRKLWSHGVRPAVLLVGTDERVYTCRHPVPTSKKLKNYAMLSIVGEREGLHISLSRSVHIGKCSEELQVKYDKVVQVDNAMIAHTIVGQSSEHPFQLGQQAFESVGYSNEWQNHHQGGPTGYSPREYRAGEGRVDHIYDHQLYAWNPTLQGTKSEDTILTIKDQTPQILTSIPSWWPSTQYEQEGKVMVRPSILQL